MGCRSASHTGGSAQRAEEAVASRVPDTSLRLERARPGCGTELACIHADNGQSVSQSIGQPSGASICPARMVKNWKDLKRHQFHVLHDRLAGRLMGLFVLLR